MQTQSGCFCTGTKQVDPIDTLEEVSATVDEIVSSDNGTTTDDGAAAYQMTLYFASMDRRIRLLTWAVVAIVAVMIIKEVNAK